MILFRKIFVLLLVFTSLAGSASSWSFPVHRLQAEIKRITQSGRKPVAVVDLDETVIHTIRRKVMSYKAAITRGQVMFGMKYPTETQILLRTSETKLLDLMYQLPNLYDSKAWLGRLGIQNELFRADFDKAMLAIYLSDEWVHLDRAFHGAQALLESFYRVGGEVYFVSSRYRAKQHDSTVHRLLLSKLYRNPLQSHVILREDNESSLDFKVRAFQHIRQQTQNFYTVALVAENEPENLNAMMSMFPTAMPVFVVGAVLNTSVTVNPNARLIKTKNWLAGSQDFDYYPGVLQARR